MGKEPYWFIFPGRKLDWVETRYTDLGRRYTHRINQEENVQLYQYAVIFMVIY